MANRANAKRSTGPKTAAGKALSRMNACKHGLTAHNTVIRDEDPNKFDSLMGCLSSPSFGPWRSGQDQAYRAQSAMQDPRRGCRRTEMGL